MTYIFVISGPRTPPSPPTPGVGLLACCPLGPSWTFNLYQCCKMARNGTWGYIRGYITWEGVQEVSANNRWCLWWLYPSRHWWCKHLRAGQGHGNFHSENFPCTFPISEANYWSSEFLNNQSLNLVQTGSNLCPKARTTNWTYPPKKRTEPDWTWTLGSVRGFGIQTEVLDQTSATLVALPPHKPSGQAKPRPGQSQLLWLGLMILEAKATGFQAKPSQNITKPSMPSDHRQRTLFPTNRNFHPALQGIPYPAILWGACVDI